MITQTTHTEAHLLEGLVPALNLLGQTIDLPIAGRIVQLEPIQQTGRYADAIIDIDVNGQTYRYVVEVKTRVDRLAAIGQLKAQFDRFGERGLLFAPRITTAIAKKCRELNIAFLDTVGNAYFHLPGLHIFITGEKPDLIATPLPLDRRARITTIGAQRAGTATALRVIFTLLCNPELLNAPYRDIVGAANVALGAVGWIFFDLEARGHTVGKQQKHDRRFTDAARLFEEWVTNYPIKLRPKLNARYFRAENPQWWQNADLKPFGAYWGGEVAANRLTDYLKPANVTIFVNTDKDPRALTQLIIDHRLRADPNGNIEILDAFWNLPEDPEHPDVVPPILAYADLVATQNPRNVAAAKLIRERYIDHALRQI